MYIEFVEAKERIFGHGFDSRLLHQSYYFSPKDLRIVVEVMFVNQTCRKALAGMPRPQTHTIYGAVLVFDGIVSTNAESSRQLNAKNIFKRIFSRPQVRLAVAA